MTPRKLKRIIEGEFEELIGKDDVKKLLELDGEPYRNENMDFYDLSIIKHHGNDNTLITFLLFEWDEEVKLNFLKNNPGTEIIKYSKASFDKIFKEFDYNKEIYLLIWRDDYEVMIIDPDTIPNEAKSYYDFYELEGVHKFYD